MAIVLKKEPLIKKITSLLIELGLFDACILEGEGVEEAAAQAIPVFSSLQDLFGAEYSTSKFILAPVPDLDTVREFLSLSRSEGIDFREPGMGAVAAFPCTLFVSADQGESPGDDARNEAAGD